MNVKVIFLPTVFTDGTPSVADKIEKFVKLIGHDSIAAPYAMTVYFIRAQGLYYDQLQEFFKYVDAEYYAVEYDD